MTYSPVYKSAIGVKRTIVNNGLS